MTILLLSVLQLLLNEPFSHASRHTWTHNCQITADSQSIVDEYGEKLDGHGSIPVSFKIGNPLAPQGYVGYALDARCPQRSQRALRMHASPSHGFEDEKINFYLSSDHYISGWMWIEPDLSYVLIYQTTSAYSANENYKKVAIRYNCEKI